MSALTDERPHTDSTLAIYIHVPYCTRKCPYCDFNVHVVREIPERRYVDALLAELEAAGAQQVWRSRPAATLFFGGGTPSLFAPESFERLRTAVHRTFDFAASPEISVEANPEDVAAMALDRLRALLAAGVNRISLGVQSFDDRVLGTLGRMHHGGEATRAVERARQAGFANVSCDLIFAVPGQTLADWRSDLERVVSLAPEHVSTYGLTYEDGTPFAAMRQAGRVAPAAENEERAMYEAAIDALTAAGYCHYEISNFARPGFASRHNSTYWDSGDYLGLGAGAHGFTRGFGRITDDWGLRYANVKAPGEYMARVPHARDWSEALDRQMAMAEFLMLGLRRIEGFDEDKFEQTFGVALGAVSPALEMLVGAGLLTRDTGKVALTRAGLMLADSVTAKLADLRS